MGLTKVRGAGIDADGQEIIIDADGDTTITADTDDQIDIRIAGADDFAFKANTFEVQTGSNIDMNGTELILDADGDTSITADTDDQIDIKIGGNENLRLTNSVTGSGYTADSGTSLQSHPIMAIRASGQSRTDSYYDFPVDTNGGCFVIAGYSHDQSTSTYARFENFQVGHNATYIGIYTLNANGGNGDITVTKPSNNVLRVTFDKNESSGSGSYGTIEFVAVFGANPF